MPDDFYINLLEHSPLACFVIDENLNELIYKNPAFNSLINREITGLDTFLELSTNKDQSYLKEAITMPKNSTGHIDFTIQLSDDQEKHIRLVPFPFGTSGRQNLTACYATDITDETVSTELLKKYANKKNSVLTILSHDLRGPLGVAQNVIQLLSKKGSDENFDKLINIITKVNKQSIDLITNLIDREFLESTEIVLCKKRINISLKMKEVMEEYKRSEELSKRTFNFYTSHENIFLDLDEAKFMQIVNNLMANALKFTTEEGTISLCIKAKSEYVMFIFSDNGIGIPEDLQPKVFDKFTDAKRKGLLGEPTTGLGLSIIKTIVEWHDGEIWLESKEGKGTSFYFKIPFSN